MNRGLKNCTGGSEQNHPKEKKNKKAEWLSEEALQITKERREKKQERKGKVYPTKCRFPKNSTETRGPSLMNSV